MRRPSGLETLGVVLAVTLGAVALTWPLALHFGSRLIFFWGDPVLNCYVLAWDQYALLHCPTNVMSAPFLYPFTSSVALSENLLGAAVLGYPFAVSGNPLFVYNAVLILSFVLTGGGWYVVLRRWGITRAAAWLGAFSFAFLPWRFSQIGHLQLLLAWWVPVAVGATEAWVRTGSWRSAILLGISVAMSFYVCVYNTFNLLFFLAGCVAAGWMASPVRRRFSRRRIAQAAGAASIFGVLLLPVLPAYLHVKDAIPGVNSLSMIAARGAAVSDYLRPPAMNRLLGWITDQGFRNPYSDVPWEHELFLGLLAPCLALSLPLLLRVRPMPVGRSLRRIAWMIGAGTAVCFVLSLGPVLHLNGQATFLRLPYEFFYRHLPGFDSLRVPTRAALFVGLGTSALGAIALHGWLVLVRRKSVRWTHFVAVAAVAVLAAEHATERVPVEDNADYLRHLVVQRQIAGMERGTVLVVPLEWRLNYLAPLTTTSHFYPLVNGVSGHLPPACKPGFSALEKTMWDDEQIEMLRTLGVRYIVEDHRQSGRPAFEDMSLRDGLIARGVSADVVEFPDLGLTLHVLGAPPGDPERAAKHPG